MATVLCHQMTVDESHLPHQSTDDRQFEDNTHDQTHAQQCIDIRLQRQHVGDIGRYLIGTEETDGEGEYHQVVDQCSDEEHQVGGSHDPYGIPPLVLIESW